MALPAQCTYVTETECNCRKHIGSVHGQPLIRCLRCGSKQSTVSNLNKHIKKCHASGAATQRDAAAANPRSDENGEVESSSLAGADAVAEA